MLVGLWCWWCGDYVVCDGVCVGWFCCCGVCWGVCGGVCVCVVMVCVMVCVCVLCCSSVHDPDGYHPLHFCRARLDPHRPRGAGLPG